MKEFEVYSDKLKSMIKVSENISDDENRVIMEDVNSSMVGWTHGGWNNNSGGGSW